MKVIHIIESLSVIIAALGTLLTVFLGINAWRREQIGKKKLELAEDVLALFYRLSREHPAVSAAGMNRRKFFGGGVSTPCALGTG